MMKKLKLLSKQLKELKFSEYSSKIERIIKICSMPGIDYPTEETEVEGIDEVLEYLDKNPGKFIFLDNPVGTEKRFGQRNYREMPFHYGEFVEINNPADDMGWDLVIVPSSSAIAKTEEGEGGAVTHVPTGHSLMPVGYVPVNDSQKEWTRRTKSKNRPQGKPAPVGNDKIILAPREGWDNKDEDKRVIEEFFGSMWNFKDVIWL